MSIATHLLAAAWLSGSVVAGQAETAPRSAPAPTGAAPSGTAPTAKRICRAIVPTGSVMPKRFCLTSSEWRTFNGLNQENANAALQKRGTGMCDVGAGGCQ